MIIDNFNQIVNLLNFESEDDFYHLQILRRKKDLPEHARGKNNNARTVKTYLIRSSDDLLSYKNEIIKLCNCFSARAYINLNSKSFYKSALRVIPEITERIIQNQSDYVNRAYYTVIGDSKVNTGKPSWIIDIDTKDSEIIEEICNKINECNSGYIKVIDEKVIYNNIIDRIETVNGWHIITRRFNLKQFESTKIKYKLDVHKNNPTLLYFDSEAR